MLKFSKSEYPSFILKKQTESLRLLIIFYFISASNISSYLFRLSASSWMIFSLIPSCSLFCLEAEDKIYLLITSCWLSSIFFNSSFSIFKISTSSLWSAFRMSIFLLASLYIDRQIPIRQIPCFPSNKYILWISWSDAFCVRLFYFDSCLCYHTIVTYWQKKKAGATYQSLLPAFYEHRGHS